MNRHLSRMVAMQTLYECDFRVDAKLPEVLERNVGEYSEKCEAEFIQVLVNEVYENKVELDEIINDSAPEWPVDQISLIDKTILRIAVFELLHIADIPPKVSINEAVELSKQFGSENSSKFVNGVLGTVYKKYELDIEKNKSKQV